MTSRSLLAAAGVLLFFPQIVSAEEPVETALRDMIEALDATPEWAASFGNLSYDAVTETATITDFTARTEKPGTEISIARISVTGYSEAPDGSFSIRSAIASDGQLKSGIISTKVDNFGIEDLTVPVMDSIVFNPTKPFTSIVAIYRQAVKAEFSHARVGTIVVDQDFDGVKSQTVYENLRLDGFANGRIESMRAGPIRFETPSPQDLMTTSIGSLEGYEIDLAAVLRVYDPDDYQDGVGDMVWHDGMRRIAYHNILMEMPGAKLTIDAVAVDAMRVRQPPRSFAAFLDAVLANPSMSDSWMEQLAKRHLPDMLGAWSLGKLTISDIAIDAQNIDHLAFGGITLADLSMDGLGEFAIEDFGVSIRGEGAVRLGRFAIGDIPIGGIDGLEKILRSIDAPTEPDLENFMPTPGFLEIVDVEAQTPDIDRLSLNRFRIDLDNYIGVVPTVGKVELTNLVMPTSAVDDRQAQQMLRRFGYEQIDFSALVETEWAESGDTLTVKELRFDLKDMGSLAMNFILQGLPLEAFTDDKAFVAAMPGLKLERGELTFTDASMVGNGLELLAEQMNAPPETFRKQFADAIPFFLSMATINDPQLMALIQRSGLLPKLTPVVRDFVAAPGASITFSARPQSPVAITAIAEAAESAPDSLVPLLGLTISGTPGVMPEEEVEDIEVEVMPVQPEEGPGTQPQPSPQ